MGRDYFLKTDRIGFSKWGPADGELARFLWSNPRVTKYICADGVFSSDDVAKRLRAEVSNGEKYGVQYWPVFSLLSGQLVGCCGLRPHSEADYEIGFHLRPEFWGQGYGREAAEAVIRYAFSVLHAKSLFAGHNPHNTASRKLLTVLGFAYVRDEFYAPTGLYHPSYLLLNPKQE